MKNYSNEVFMEQLKPIKFPECYACVNDAYKNFVTKFLSVINFVTPITALGVKCNTKSWFDIDVLNVI